MNRYGRGQAIGPSSSKATASTLCQKCLKRGHYSFECKAVAQERPYVSRPSRTQQLLNPKLVPKLTSDVPQELLRKKGVADEQLAKLEKERGRARERSSEKSKARTASNHLRSDSSLSVSTISTDRSRSQSPPRRQTLKESNNHRARSKTRSRSWSRSPPRRRSLKESGNKRRRVSSADSDTSDAPSSQKDPEARTGSRSTRRRLNQSSPSARGRQVEDRSPYRDRRLSDDRRQPSHQAHIEISSNDGRPSELIDRDYWPPPRERSLSPFSRRKALTQAMSMGR